MVVRDYKRKTCLLIDILIQTDNIMSVKVYTKLNNYKNLEIEIRKMWHLKTTILPVVVGVMGIINKGTDKHIYKIPL